MPSHYYISGGVVNNVSFLYVIRINNNKHYKSNAFYLQKGKILSFVADYTYKSTILYSSKETWAYFYEIRIGG